MEIPMRIKSLPKPEMLLKDIQLLFDENLLLHTKMHSITGRDLNSFLARKSIESQISLNSQHLRLLDEMLSDYISITIVQHRYGFVA
jgi:hypothetical protein